MPDTFIPPKVDVINTSVGIDVGLKEFAATSDGEFIPNPRFLRKMEPKLKRAQRKHSKKKKGSKNKEKARIKLAKLHKKVANQRKDFVTKTANSIFKSNDLVAIEDLSSSNMMRNHKLAKSIADASWFQFRQALAWQAAKQGKHLVVINRYFPSSKTCSCCGAKRSLTLADRTYECDSCGLKLDRDINAARNILKEGIHLMSNTAGTAEIHACGNMNCQTSIISESEVMEADSAQEAQSLSGVG